MFSKAIVVVLSLHSLVSAAPLPTNDNSKDQPGWIKTIQNVAGSPFGNGGGNGNKNSAGNGNVGNGNDNFGGNGNENGNHNSFGNGNGFLSGNSGLGIGRRTDWSKQPNGQPWGSSGKTSDIAGSPFGNGNNNGNGNTAGSGNSNNGNGNFGKNGNGNGNGNTFGNGNSFLSGNQGLEIGKKVKKSSSLGSYISTLGQNTGTLVDGATLPLLPANSKPVINSPNDSGNSNGNGNSAGNNNSNNRNGNLGNNGDNNLNGNTFGNGNSVLSGNCGVRREAAAIPPGTFYLVPPQTVDSLNQDFSQLFTIVIPETGPAVIKGALTGKYPGTPTRTNKEKRQVLTGIENIVAQAVSDEAPPNRSGFFGINI